MKSLLIIFTLLVCCCYCLESESGMVEERAKKKRTSKLWTTFLLLIISKIAVSKIVYTMVFWVIFQKIFYLVGWFVNFWLKSRKAERFVNTDGYNSHHDYNTLGYSYGAPAQEHNENVEWKFPPHSEPVKDSYGAPQNWPYTKRSVNEVQ